MTRSRGAHIVGVFAHPLTLFCLGGWILNDHVLKPAFGNALTGKLSDAFGLVVFPLLVAAFLPGGERRRIDSATVATAMFFIAINTSASANEATLSLLDLILHDPHLTPDLTDLITLPALLLARTVWVSPVPVCSRHVKRVGWCAFALSMVATTATSSDGRLTSDRVIVRIETLDDGRFAALHLPFIDLGPGEFAEPVDVPAPEGDIERTFGGVVYTSIDGQDWISDATISSASLDWDAVGSGCVSETCIDFDPALVGDGTITDPDGETIFRLIEPAPPCHDGLASRLSPIGGEECLNNSAPGPVDLAINSDGIAVVALGTQGVAVFDGDDWSQVAINTPGPRPWVWRNLGTLIWLGLAAVLWFFALLGVFAYRRRYRDPELIENPIHPADAQNGETPDP